MVIEIMKTTKEKYTEATKEIVAFLGPEGYALTDIGKMASISSILHRWFPEWLFVGFYRTIQLDLLEIGPYQGDILACGRIPFGKGVCGTAAMEKKTVIVPDVMKFPGYIACDSLTRSEIVVPVIREGRVTAVLDIDSEILSAFSEIDQKALEVILTVL